MKTNVDENGINMIALYLLIQIWMLSTSTTAYAIIQTPNATSSRPKLQHHRRDGPDPADFGWVHRWAAIGDSFTAGIGSGNLYSRQKADFQCSRYDHSYPAIVNQALGPAVRDFQFSACSGDRSQQIYDQVTNLKGDLDLVMMTAGGNDLCLAGIIKACVFLPFQGEKKCQTVLDKAQENIKTILKPNLKEILLSMDDKMTKDSIVVFNKYAQYFNTDNDACTNDQSWAVPKWLSTFKAPLPLTIDRRKSFNTLVININNAIGEVVDDVTKTGDVKYTIYAADWDVWPQQGVSGQYCDPLSTGRYPDAKQPDLQFFKPDTFVSTSFHDELKRRSPEEEQRVVDLLGDPDDVYRSLLYMSENPPAATLHKLDPRAPAPPNCPGDGGIDFTLGLGIPDSFGKYFHPNELGHETISAFALETMMEARAKVLKIDNPTCEWKEEFKCWQNDGRKAYACPDRVNKNYQDFCNQVKAPDHTVGWKNEKVYNQGTPDEHSFLIQLSNKATMFDKDQCLESFDRIINGCDGNDPKNPMDWKFGGRYVRDEYTYELNVARDNRPWPPIQAAYGACEGWYKVFYGNYKVHGAGWSGEDRLRSNVKGCIGGGLTHFKFEYYDQPDKDGMEWGASFNTPIWVRNRCFKNNEVARSSGGFTDGCKGND